MHRILVEIVLQSFKDMGATPDQLRSEREKLLWVEGYLDEWIATIDRAPFDIAAVIGY